MADPLNSQTQKKPFRADSISSLSDEDRQTFLKSLTDKEAEVLLYMWEFWAREEQLMPDGDHSKWLILAGRGFGKTRTGAETVRHLVCHPTDPKKAGRFRHVALIGETAKDARDVMVEGESGLLAVHPPEFRPIYEPSKARITWPNGARATLFNATEPDQLRGPQFDLAWMDELAKWKRADSTYDMLQFCMRLGSKPLQIITTTPRPTPLVKHLVADEETHVTRGSTYDNAANLAPSFLKEIKERYEGTRLGKQELNAEILGDVPGALWTHETLRECKTQSIPELVSIVVGVDPSATDLANEKRSTSECGIVVAGKDAEGIGYILEDASAMLSPAGWAKKALYLFDKWEADSIIIEVNQGGAMVKQTLRTVDTNLRNVPIKEVRATRGKYVRAEPIAALYEQRRVRHIADAELSVLEEQMCAMTPVGHVSGERVDRVDALVWALTYLYPNPRLKAKREDDIFQGDKWDVGSDAAGMGTFGRRKW